MKITNAYQAILAKLGGNKDINIPAPRNKYEKLLNDISENGGSGSSGGGLVVHDTEGTLDKTWREINNAMAGGTPVIIYSDYGDDAPSVFQVVGSSSTLVAGEVAYMVETFSEGSSIRFVSNSPTGYPAQND